MTASDPDRFFNRTSPGAHEWWYFDAVSDDRRDAIVIVWYAGLPFDPSYGVGTLRHLRDPSKHPQPLALDHSAIGFSWYRDGKPIAYALNGHRSDRFDHKAEPFGIEVASSRFERDQEGYHLTVATPSVEGRPIRGEFRFRPNLKTEPFERDLGSLEAPHNWILAAADCRVDGLASIGDETLTFEGRGYHDHNAGAEDLSIAMKRWEWGRVHSGPFTQIYYASEPHRGASQSLWITCRDGRPEIIREGLVVDSLGRGKRSVFGLRYASMMSLAHRDKAASSMTRVHHWCVDDGPFYRRWLSDFGVEGEDDGPIPQVRGISELLDTKSLHKPWFNWMIPYRLKWPVS